ncbi:fibroblast growth factor-binding protein 1-like [Lissotriton helveticus]
MHIDNLYSLRLKGGESFWCVFAGSPSSCPQYAANQKNYWKQIACALKKQKNLCQDPKAVLKSKECKKGPKEAHLSLSSSSLIEAASGKEKVIHPGEADAETSSKECVEDESVDQKKVAEEYCGESWGSLCAFFFSMVQDKKC